MTAQQQISSLKNLTSSRKLAGNGEVSSRHIFIMELEFVQCLSNPDYLQCMQKCITCNPLYINKYYRVS
jgi:hypothetical protein